MTTSMIIHPVSGLLQAATFIPSPNSDQRPAGTVISLLVIHNISLPPGVFGGDAVCALFCNGLNPAEDPYFAEIAAMKVSSHLFIRRDGEIVQFVPFGQRAWHAGESSFGGRSKCNDFSIGIELEGTDTIAYMPEQYATLIAVTQVLQKAYPFITAERIVGHSDIAPLRKTDPGPAFDWSYYRKEIVKNLTS